MFGSHLPTVSLSLHPIGGFCAVTRQLPLTADAPPASCETAEVKGNGMNAQFGDTLHCLSAEPDATFLRVSVTSGGEEVAFETAVVGRLRRGYRVFCLRSLLGTRIELCYLFVHISFGTEWNDWIPPTQLRRRTKRHQGDLRQAAKLQGGQHSEANTSSAAVMMSLKAHEEELQKREEALVLRASSLAEREAELRNTSSAAGVMSLKASEEELQKREEALALRASARGGVGGSTLLTQDFPPANSTPLKNCSYVHRSWGVVVAEQYT